MGRNWRKDDPNDPGNRARARWVASAAAKAERLAHWQTVDNLYQGFHWQKARPSWRPDPVVNYTFHVVEEHRGQLAQIKAEPVFNPRRPLDDKKVTVLREVVQYRWSKVMTELQDLANMTFLLKGTVILHPFWNPEITGGAPEPIEIMTPVMGPGGSPLLDQFQQPLQKPAFRAAGDVFVGDWDCRLIDPAHFFIDPGLASHDLQEAAWCGVGQLRLKSWCEQMFGRLPDEVSSSAADVLQQGYVRPTTNYTTAPTGDSYVYLYEEYEKLPCDAAHKAKGYRHNLVKRVYVNWVQVDEKEYFYKPGLYPFVAQHNYVIPGQFWAMGDPQVFMALERLIRKIYEQIGLNVLLTANQQKIGHPLAGIHPNTVTSQPGRVYMPGPAWPTDLDPKRALQNLDLQGMPPYVIQFVEMLKQDITLLTGLFQGLPAGVTAASAVIAVFERLAARIKRKGEAASTAARGIVEQVVNLITEHYEEARVFRLTQPIDGVPWTVFKGSDYAGIELDIEMDMQATAPLSKAVTAEQAQMAFKAGVLTGSEFLEAIDFPKKEIIEQVKRREEEQREFQRMQAQAQAQPAPVAGATGGGAAPAELPPGLTLEGAPPSAKTLVMNQLAQAGG